MLIFLLQTVVFSQWISRDFRAKLNTNSPDVDCRWCLEQYGNTFFCQPTSGQQGYCCIAPSEGETSPPSCFFNEELLGNKCSLLDHQNFNSPDNNARFSVCKQDKAGCGFQKTLTFKLYGGKQTKTVIEAQPASGLCNWKIGLKYPKNAKLNENTVKLTVIDNKDSVTKIISTKTDR